MKIESKMIYSELELEPDFSFAINSVPDFDSASESDSKSDCDSSSVFMNLDIWFILNKPVNNFFNPFS